MRGLDEDVLDVSSHLGIPEDLVALVHHEELALPKIYLTFSKLMSFL